MSGNGTSGSFGTGPASGYFLNFMFIFIVFVTNTLDHALNFIYKNDMIYALILGIKMNRNWPLIPQFIPEPPKLAVTELLCTYRNFLQPRRNFL